MAESTDKWAKKVDHAVEHAQKVYEREVDRLNKQIEQADAAEAAEVRHVEKQVARDARFAAHHITHLENVIAHEANRVDNAYARIEHRKEKGASEASIQRAAERAVRVEAAAEAHIEAVFESTVKHIERDVRAAAFHIIEGFEDLELDEESLGYQVQADAERVAAAIAKVQKKAEG